MKKEFQIALAAVLAVLALTACKVETGEDAAKDLRDKLEKDRLETDRQLDEILNSLKRGGQPGFLTLQGALVQADLSLDKRVKAVMQGGLGFDGARAPVKKDTKPDLKIEVRDLGLDQLSGERTLIAIGCDDNKINQMAEERSLVVRPLMIPIQNPEVSQVSAHTVLLCGNLEGFRFTFASFEAEELILDHVQFTHVGPSGMWMFAANKLTLNGPNQIEVKGVTTGAAFASVAPGLDFRVAKEISSSDDGQLTLITTGSDYPTDTKLKK